MKNISKILIALSIVYISTIYINMIFATGLGDGFDNSIFNQISGGEVDQNIQNVAQKIYATVSLIIRIIAVAGVAFTGYKYMSSDGNSKGQIKQTLIYVIIGTVFVFTADAVIKFVINFI